MKRTKHEAEHTREAILDAAERLFFDHGVARTSLSQIAQAAGLTRGAIYWHFKGKLDLFQAMEKRARLPQEAFFEQIGTSEQPSFRDLYDNTVAALRHLENDERVCRVLTILLFRCEYVGEMQPAMIRSIEADLKMSEAISGIFAAASDCGNLKPEWCAGDAAIAYISAVRGVISEWLRTGHSFDLVAIGSRMIHGVIEAFACPRAWDEVPENEAVARQKRLA